MLTDGIRFGYSSLYSEFIDKSFFPFPYKEVQNNSAQLAANAAIIFHPESRWKTSLLLSTGYRVPNVDDLSKVFESVPGTLIVPNPDLGPEMTYNAELGLTWETTQFFSWENALYYTLFNDAIVSAPYKFNGQDSVLYDGEMSKVYANQNMKESYIYGFSSTAILHPRPSLQFRATAGYSYGRINTDSTDQPLDHIPPFMVRLQSSFTKNKFRGELVVQYTSWKDLKDYGGGEDNLQYATPEGMSAWIVFNVKLNYQLNKTLLLQAGCENIFDVQYRVFASGINAPGRNFSISVRAKF